MSREFIVRVVRQAVVVVATVAVIGVAVATVQVAAEWRAASAPLDAAPVSMGSIQDDYAVEEERAADLAAQMDGVAKQISTLQSALVTANGSVADDSQSAEALQAELATAKTKLTGITKQLKAAQRRLQELNQAAARQAAMNRAASRRATPTRTTRSQPAARPEPTPEPRETREPDDDD